jgi:hypothetical protein
LGWTITKPLSAMLAMRRTRIAAANPGPELIPSSGPMLARRR